MIVLLLSLIAITSAKLPEGYVGTPHGMRPSECVIQVESGSFIEETPQGLLIESPGQKPRYMKVPDVCNQDMPRWKDARMKRRQAFINDEPNQWIDNAGWYAPGRGSFGGFTGNYTVPGTPASPEKKLGKLYWFIGFENMGGGPVNILQPVLTYEYVGWTYSSWCCCPSNITIQSNVIKGIKPGDVVGGVIQRVNSDTWTIDSINPAGQHATLKPRVGPYTYNWADVTFELEQDGIPYSCDQYAKGPWTSSAMVVKDHDMKTLTPSWKPSGRTSCSGSTSVKSPSEIVITHN